MILLRFLMFWAVNTLVLWAASEVFSSVRYASAAALLVAGLLFGLAHTFLKPVLVELGASCPVRGLYLLDTDYESPEGLDQWIESAQRFLR
jgi:uncharacterized membrane protein YvlD (DUF360 family)